MSDTRTYSQLAESIKQVSFLKELPDVEEEERGELETYLQDLASRQESKFDAIIALIKKCDTYVEALQSELNEIKENLDVWKKNKEKITNIIKYAYQNELINSQPVGVKYQATIKRVKPRLVPNFDNWEEQDRVEFGLRITTTITRIKDDTVVDIKEEEVPDKDRLREALKNNSSLAPGVSQLIPGYALVYERRKRLTT